MAKSIPWKLLEKQFYTNRGYQDTRDKLRELHAKENQERNESGKQICSFAKDSTINFNQLDNYNDRDDKSKINPEILEFMHLLMDECTHLINYAVPVDPSMINVISAKEDAYILRDGVNDFKSIWPDSQVEYLDQGHVSAFILSQNKFR